MKNIRWCAALCVVLLASGCAFNDQAVRVTPQVEVAPGTVGEGVAVRVNVVDERPKTTLGTRGARGVGADLTIEGDIVSTIRDAIETGLQRLSFETSQDPAQDRELRVELRSLDYNVLVGFWAGTLKVDTAMKAICRLGDLRPYEQLHRGEFTESVQVVQGEEANNGYVSASVSEALNSLLGDQELMACLAR